MNARLMAFAVLAVASAAASGMKQGTLLRQPSAAAAAVVLLPESIGERGIVRRWNNPRSNGSLEQGALYQSAAAVAVQLDFFRNISSTHNGIGCYLAEGESLVWEKMHTLRMASGEAQFDIALLSSNDNLRLVAATECGAQGCSENTLWGEPIAGSKLRWEGSAPHSDSVVPASIVLTSPLNGEDSAVVEARLMSQLQDAARLIDLAPAQKLAALQ